MANKQIDHPKLFELPPADQEYALNIKPWQDIEAQAAGVVDPTENGPAVDIESRAYHLDKSLQALGKASQREHGLGVAIDVEPHSSKIWARYKGGTPTVIERALGNAEQLKDDSKRHFWHATGLQAMVGSGMISEREAKARARQLYSDFYHKHAGPTNRKARDKRRKIHAKQLKT
jgi:hypothetical protein